MQMGEGASVSTIQCSDSCPFCREKSWHGYTTKHGTQKDEDVLKKSLWSSAEISSDKTVGSIYPLAGGGDTTTGWLAASDVFEEFEVAIPAAPHHIIPGQASMAPSTLEKWTRESKGKIKEDIGYSIDCAQNGIFLPHLPEIYFTRHKTGTKTPQARYYGQTWADLSDTAKESIGFTLMGETGLQMHYTDHSAVFAGSASSYDDVCKQECNQLSQLIMAFYLAAKCADDDGKVAPPYSVVARINSVSRKIKNKITGNPRSWSLWVSPLANQLTTALKSNGTRIVSRNQIARQSK